MKRKVATQQKKKLLPEWIEEEGFAVPLAAHPAGKPRTAPEERRTPGRARVSGNGSTARQRPGVRRSSGAF